MSWKNKETNEGLNICVRPKERELRWCSCLAAAGRSRAAAFPHFSVEINVPQGPRNCRKGRETLEQCHGVVTAGKCLPKGDIVSENPEKQQFSATRRKK